MEVKIAQNRPQQGEHGRVKGAVVGKRCPEEQVAQLGVGKEDDEEHDAEAGNVAATTVQCAGQLRHRLVEGDVLEQLHPGEEDADGNEGFEHVRPVAQVLEKLKKLYS